MFPRMNIMILIQLPIAILIYVLRKNAQDAIAPTPPDGSVGLQGMEP